MGLDFTNIHDEHGAAIYFIHDGTDKDRQKFEGLMHEVAKRTKKQVVLLSVATTSATDMISFYQLRGSHFVLIVRDDDQLHHVWSDGEHFDAAQIAYTAEQAG